MSLEREESVLKCLVDVDVKRQPIFDCTDEIFPLCGPNVDCFDHALIRIQTLLDVIEKNLLRVLDSEYDHTWREELQKLQPELSKLDLQVFQISEKVNLSFANLRKGYWMRRLALFFNTAAKYQLENEESLFIAIKRLNGPRDFDYSQ